MPRAMSRTCVKQRVCVPSPSSSTGYWPPRIFFTRSGMTCASPTSSPAASSGPMALNGRRIVYGRPYWSKKARQYHSPISLLKP